METSKGRIILRTLLSGIRVTSRMGPEITFINRIILRTLLSGIRVTSRMGPEITFINRISLRQYFCYIFRRRYRMIFNQQLIKIVPL